MVVLVELLTTQVVVVAVLQQSVQTEPLAAVMAAMEQHLLFLDHQLFIRVVVAVLQ
jgi:hypothetical protein